MSISKRRLFGLLCIIVLFVASPALAQSRQPEDGTELTFTIAADMRNYSGPGDYDTPQYFRGALEAINALGVGAFLLTPGDMDPLTSVYWSITSTLGTPPGGVPWVPVIGNHELPGGGVEPSLGANVAWLNNYDQGVVNPGPSGCPKTTFSFDRPPAHFVALDLYCNEAGGYDPTTTDADVPDFLYNWLVTDLQANTQPYVFVIGHEPAYVQPDADNGRLRHNGTSLDEHPAHRDRFWSLLQAEGVIAYLCGHTHNFSAVEIGGVWQIDAGHARGIGDPGAPSTFVQIQILPGSVRYLAYRDDGAGGVYTLRYSGQMMENGVYLPLMQK